MTRTAILLSLALGAAAPAAAAEFKIVVNANNPVSALRRADVSDLFLKKATRFADGRAVEPIELASELRARFYEAIHGKSVGAVKSYWQKLIFSGREVPPIEKAHATEVVDFVRARPGAIGFVPADAATAGVKVLTIEE